MKKLKDEFRFGASNALEPFCEAISRETGHSFDDYVAGLIDELTALHESVDDEDVHRSALAYQEILRTTKKVILIS